MDDIKEDVAVLKEHGRWIAKELSEIKSDVKTLLAKDNVRKGRDLGFSAVVAVIVSLIVAWIGK